MLKNFLSKIILSKIISLSEAQKLLDKNTAFIAYCISNASNLHFTTNAANYQGVLSQRSGEVGG